MRIHLIAVGRRMPKWVRQGYDEFAKRLPRECSLHLTELEAGKRGKGADVERIVRDEGQRMLAALPKGTRVVVLDERGELWDTMALSRKLDTWLLSGADVALLVGGPEGLADDCRARADEAWSLSPLTLPHPLVRIIVAEQLYRAWSVLQGHPYHRGG